MTFSPLERKIRAGLPLTRFLQVCLPPSLTGGLLKWSLKRARLPAGVSRAAVSADGVAGEWITPRAPAGAGGPVLLYLHGGGFVYGLTPPHLQMVAYLAQQMGARALLVDYRLAPAHPFPAALDDCVTVYRWLLRQNINPAKITLAGDSAGGNLTIAALMTLRDAGDPLPAAAACLSPALDLSNKEARLKEFADPVLPPAALKFYNRAYVGAHDPRTPLISPVFGDWRGLPPLLAHVGEDEILREDAVRLAALAQAAGGTARLEIYPRMWHVWQLYLGLPQAVHSLDAIARFLTAHLAALE